MSILSVIKNRVSCRSFTSQSIDHSIVERIIEAGGLAPSAKNRQPWRFIVISDKNVKKIVSEACYGAEVINSADKVIAVCTTNVNYVMPNGQEAHVVDLSIATSFMVLQSEHEGLGSCIVTTYNEDILKEVLTIPFSMRVFSLIALGYKGEECSKIKNERKSHTDLYNYDHW